MLLCPLVSFGQFSGVGMGTSSSPYLITSAEQLDEVRNFLSTEGVYFRLESDLDLTSFIQENNPSSGWVPIGTTSNPFKGVFLGNCKTIKGLFINRPNQDYVGLFGRVNSGTISQLMIKNCNISGNTAVAGISGKIEGNARVSECGVTGNITGVYAVAGIVGSEEGAPTQSKLPIISDCFFDGNISAGNSSATTSAGGIVGYLFKSAITRCYATGTIHSSYNVGGICGWFSNAGYQHPGYMTYCVGANSKLWGSNWTGRISGQYDNYSYVLGGNKAYNGMEIYFQESATPRDNVYDNFENGVDNGTGVSMSELMQASTYTSMGWDFTNIWAIDEGTSLPYFIWSKAPEYYDLTISSYGLSTLYLDYSVKIPYDEYDPDLLGVYYAYDISNGEVRLARLQEFIPAGTAVIVQGNSGTYRFMETKSVPDPLKYDNLLRGSSQNISVAKAKENTSSDAVIMMLGKGSNGYVGFYKYTRQTIPAHRAYILYDNAENANSLSLSLIQDVSGIAEAPESIEDNDTYFTLQGVKIDKLHSVSKGIYIKNGKKFIIR